MLVYKINWIDHININYTASLFVNVHFIDSFESKSGWERPLSNEENNNGTYFNEFVKTLCADDFSKLLAIKVINYAHQWLLSNIIKNKVNFCYHFSYSEIDLSLWISLVQSHNVSFYSRGYFCCSSRLYLHMLFIFNWRNVLFFVNLSDGSHWPISFLYLAWLSLKALNFTSHIWIYFNHCS